MTLLQYKQVSMAYGDSVLLDHVDCQISTGDRICLSGRNGEGKSTFMKIAADLLQPDEGIVWRQNGLKIGHLLQNVPDLEDKTVFDVIASGLSPVGELLSKWHYLTQNANTDSALQEMEVLQNKIEHLSGWQFQTRIEQMIDKLGVNQSALMNTLSGGFKRRVMLGRALMNEPELLLLDEPTNHMDLLMIQELEQILKSFSGALLFITHDRAFLKTIATSILELDRGSLQHWHCHYEDYLEQKVHRLEVEAVHRREFDKKWQQEEAWLRQGVKARRTRNEGRIRALSVMREAREKRRMQQKTVQFSLDKALSSGQLVVELQAVHHGYDDHVLIKNLDLIVMKGDKIGLIGGNGVGKTTLIKILLGEIKANSGTVRLGTQLKVAYFGQMLDQIDLTKTVIDNVSEGREYLTINGKERHIVSYLEQFLFDSKRLRMPAKSLSGGERSRLMLARLFSQSFNFLVLDEPTNDLDLETLELLESILLEYTDTLLIVSHDRDFLDQVITSSLVFEGQGVIREFVGGFTDWLHQGGSISQLSQTTVQPDQAIKKESINLKSPQAKTPKQKLSFHLQQELNKLPAQIEALESTILEIELQTSAPDFYHQPYDEVQRVLKKLQDLNDTLESKMARWLELDA
ncbi:MAG: ATP-binding cassette domain-containing protein [Endozoicomonadaceae bacterium]|nr:ATP-binding cassette domain-containing protein [Endozoicomonadaceae bacterium]